MNNLLLSICIPTYNRAACLRQCLESIVTQFGDFDVRKRVEVVISDNGSIDDTQFVVQDFLNEFSNIRYYKNLKNLGYDSNALSLVEKAQGEFVCFLGDDDALFPDSIMYLLQEIEKQKFKYCIVNFWGYDNKLEMPALKIPNQTILKDQFYVRLADFVKEFKHKEDLVGFFCGLSGQVFSRLLWQSFPEKNNFIGTHAIHLYILMSVMKNERFAVFAKPLVKARSANIRWESFEGLDSAKQRADSTLKILIWILDFYKISYSKLSLKYHLYFGVLKYFISNFIKSYLFKSQKSRDRIKKILGKL